MFDAARGESDQHNVATDSEPAKEPAVHDHPVVLQISKETFDTELMEIGLLLCESAVLVLQPRIKVIRVPRRNSATATTRCAESARGGRHAARSAHRDRMFEHRTRTGSPAGPR